MHLTAKPEYGSDKNSYTETGPTGQSQNAPPTVATHKEHYPSHRILSIQHTITFRLQIIQTISWLKMK